MTEADKEYVHWFVANIPGKQIEKGDTLVEYLQPFPPKGTGFHRYVFVLYQQNGLVKYDTVKGEYFISCLVSLLAHIHPHVEQRQCGS